MRERSLKRSTPRRRPGRHDGTGPADVARRALEDHDQVVRLSRTFRALGDPTRSKMVFALSHGALRPSELAGALGTSLSAVSHQLRILRDLDIVRVRRDGKSQVYTLNEQAFGFCSPRSCHAWRQIEPAGLPILAGAAPAASRRATRRRATPS
jgi:DNA-binding transcriptional ArsR family regulator